ncbi:glutathione peroxidase [Moheibacter sediminis]|uniref:Glutathione peroxidase n=1 Tax=Moheibacter sediminis TaxID=1434700 RepID=A0A1W2C1Y8_9FLAO|nr:glutathione peroxidase [Moheibacter sediminis]SMC79170.1 glutathione peroxidase [Moheibacter sediminis]
MRILSLFVILISLVSCQAQNKKEMKTIYDFKVEDINGDEFNFADLKGKKILIVNTASKCGFTPQFDGLEDLYQKYKDDNFVIVGFPSNDFGQQDPGSNEEIAEYCRLNYGVTFPMMSKISVKGDSIAPIYEFLTKKELNGKKNSSVKWNFQKYIINEDGTFEDYFYSITTPDSKKISKWIERK